MRILAPCTAVFAMTWWSLWATPDQRGQQLMQREDYQTAAQTFRDPMRQGVAWFRAGEFEKAEQAFARVATPEADYNRGNCLIMQGKYEESLEFFDRALKQRSDWDEAKNNRAIAAARAKRFKQEGGDMGDQKLGADEIRFDKDKKSGGQDTDTQEAQPLSDSAMQALWLRRVQTKPADFLRAKFAFQIANEQQKGDRE